MKYRIVIEINKAGNKIYYSQKRYYKIFWKYISESDNINKAYEDDYIKERIGWKTIEEAERHIEEDKCRCNKKEEKKIVKREYVYR